MAGAHRSSVVRRLNSDDSTVLRLATGGMLVALLCGGAFTLTAKKDFVIDINGERVHVATLASTVGPGIKNSGVVIAAGDSISPDPSAKLVDGMVVRIESSPVQQLEASFAAATVKVPTTATTPSTDVVVDDTGQTQTMTTSTITPAAVSSVAVAPTVRNTPVPQRPRPAPTVAPTTVARPTQAPPPPAPTPSPLPAPAPAAPAPPAPAPQPPAPAPDLDVACSPAGAVIYGTHEGSAVDAAMLAQQALAGGRCPR